MKWTELIWAEITKENPEIWRWGFAFDLFSRKETVQTFSRSVGWLTIAVRDLWLHSTREIHNTRDLPRIHSRTFTFWKIVRVSTSKISLATHITMGLVLMQNLKSFSTRPRWNQGQLGLEIVDWDVICTPRHRRCNPTLTKVWQFITCLLMKSCPTPLSLSLLHTQTHISIHHTHISTYHTQNHPRAHRATLAHKLTHIHKHTHTHTHTNRHLNSHAHSHTPTLTHTHAHTRIHILWLVTIPHFDDWVISHINDS